MSVRVIAVLCAAAALVPNGAISRAHVLGPGRISSAAASIAGRVDSAPSCPNLPPRVKLPSTLPTNLTAALANASAVLQSFLDPVSRPGASLSISLAGRVLLYTHAGRSSKAPPTPVDDATLFRIASVSKVFPAVLMHVFADSGDVGLDDPLTSQLPVSPHNPFDSAAPTFRQLLSHTAGFQREAPVGNVSADIFAELNAGFLIWAPGARVSYSNLGFALVGYAAEAIASETGATLEELVSKAITAPLGINTTTGYSYTPDVLAHLATAYAADGSPEPFVNLGWWYAAGAMFSRARDLDVLAQALLFAATPPSPPPAVTLHLTPSRARELLAPVWWDRDGATLMGTPWEMLTHGPYLVRTKGGNLPGWTCAVALLPEIGLSLAVTFNGGGVDEFIVITAFLDAILPSLEAALVAAGPTPRWNPSPTPAAYEGTYILEGGGDVVVTLQSGLLLWHSSALGLQVGLDFFARDAGGVSGLDLFRVSFPDSAFGACLTGELEALEGQFVQFYRNDGDVRANSTSLLGWVPGAVWTRAVA